MTDDIHDVHGERLASLRVAERLDRHSHYLICNATHLVATWENNGQGWMLKTDFGLVSAAVPNRPW